jgi:hypothetical protein
LIPAEAATIRDNYQNKSSDLSICELKETENINEYGSRKGFPIKGALPTTGEKIRLTLLMLQGLGILTKCFLMI